MKKKYTLVITVGFLWYEQLRDVLREYEWNDDDFSWKEGTGWINRSFYLRGNLDDITELEERFYNWCGPVRECVSN